MAVTERKAGSVRLNWHRIGRSSAAVIALCVLSFPSSAFTEDSAAGEANATPAVDWIADLPPAAEADESVGFLANPAVEMNQAKADEPEELVTVPLPAALWLFGSGLVGFIMLSNRRSL